MKKNTNLKGSAYHRRKFEAAAKPALASALFKRAASGTLVLFLAIDGGPLGLPSVRIPIRPLRSTLGSNLRWLASGPLFVATVAKDDESTFFSSAIWAKVRPFVLALRMGAADPILIMPLDYEAAVGLGFNLALTTSIDPAMTQFPSTEALPPLPVEIAQARLDEETTHHSNVSCSTLSSSPLSNALIA